MSEHDTHHSMMNEHNIPRLFTPPILENHTNNNDITFPMLKTIIKKQQDIIDNQCKILNKHDIEIDNLKTSLQEIKHILNGRQFIHRSVSFESNGPDIEETF